MRFLLGMFFSAGVLIAADMIEAEGKLAVKGNAPFTFLALTQKGGKTYKIVGSNHDALYRLQGHHVRVTGELTRENKHPAVSSLDVKAYTVLTRTIQNKQKPLVPDRMLPIP